jgi:hypothetical protein
MKKITFCLLLLLLSLGVVAQRRTQPKRTQPAPSATPKPTPLRQKKLVETLSADNGRILNLYDDNTYEIFYGGKPLPPLNPTPINTAPASSKGITVQVQGGVINGGGDVKAVARTEFTVFNGDITSTLATVNDRRGAPLDVFGLYLAKAHPSSASIYTAVSEKLKPFTVGTFTTGFDGIGQIKLPQQAEPYYLFGYFTIGRSSCVWYLKFPGNESGTYVIDNNNSIFCG